MEIKRGLMTDLNWLMAKQKVILTATNSEKEKAIMMKSRLV